MTNVLVALGMVSALAVTGCSAQDTASSDPQASSALRSENDTWSALPLGRGAAIALRAEHVYPSALAEQCGPRYGLDVTIDFGTVTADRLAVDAVTAVFRPSAGSTVVPRKLDVWSNLSADKQIIDGRARIAGESVRYEVMRDYQLDPNDPIVVVELQTTGRADPTNVACRQVTRFVFYPEGARVSR